MLWFIWIIAIRNKYYHIINLHIHKNVSPPVAPSPGQGGVSGRGLFDSDSIYLGFFDVLKALHHE